MKFDYASPESVGLSSRLIEESLRSLDTSLAPIHSFLIARYGHIALEAYWKPFEKNSLQRMYSCTKSFVSIAIGELYSEGKLDINDPIIKYFPEYDTTALSAEIRRCTIKNMLMMASPHRRTAYKEGAKAWSYIKDFSDHDWVSPFFTVKADHEPGELFIYDTSATQTLAALVERLAGCDVLTYLKSSFLKNTEFSDSAYLIKEPGGVSAGGSGLMAKSVDMLYAIYNVMHSDSSYIKDARSKQIDTAIGSRGGLLDLSSGYGYQIWMNSHGYMFYGMGSQLIIAVPDKDIAIAITADTQGNPAAEAKIFEEVWRIVDSASDSLPSNDDALNSLNNYIKTLELKHVEGQSHSNTEALINDKEFLFDANSISLESLKCSFKDDEGVVSFRISGNEYRIPFGLGKNIKSDAYMEGTIPVYSSAAWQNDRCLAIRSCYIGEELGSIEIQLSYKDGRLTVFMKECGELSIRPIGGVATSKAL